ncbi:cysteine proteinase mucunain-like [Amaranthus tricolor]|uniref:cysteine proteinase mucunain-like n=1 Tax=Amaranthus tricolor TaxID=29722 RepID=UPI00258515DB|nr:cysteine proteinase mucunain-like [Amaranthus tricolor]
MGIYQNWLAQHGKVQNALPDPKRFEIFKDNLRFIDEHNSVNRPYKVGLNKFADMTNEEYREKFLGTQPSPYTNLLNKKINKRYLPLPGDRLPKAVDWRKVGAVNHVKDQGQCDIPFAWARKLRHSISSLISSEELHKELEKINLEIIHEGELEAKLSALSIQPTLFGEIMTKQLEYPKIMKISGTGQ